ncbi:MAG: hypothetical protein KDB82_14705 [Planctomycetes bacterium]|nr:hypothetical protein [Planctomycetota bacterium]
MAGQVAVGGQFSPSSAVTDRPSIAGWIRSPRWDKRWIIFPALLAPLPPLIYYLSMYMLERHTGMDAVTRKGAAEDIVSLFVMVLVGGPHVWVTFTRTWLHPEFRKREKFWFFASFAVVPFVATMALSSEFTRKLLLTGFFFIASLHIIHQLSYIIRFYQDRDATKPSLKSRLIDIGAVVFPLYPVSTFRMVMVNENSMAFAWASNWFGAEQAEALKFNIGRAHPLLPDFILSDWFWMVNTAALVVALTLWIGKTVREHRTGKLQQGKFLLIACAIGVGLFCPLLPNLDSSFQGFNLWHSLQYIALTWYITRFQMSKGRGQHRFVSWLANDDRSGPKYYGVAFGIVIALIALIIGIALILSQVQGVGMFGGSGEVGTMNYRPGAILQAYYLFGFGLLLTHYFHDAFLFNMHTFSKSAVNTRA